MLVTKGSPGPECGREVGAVGMIGGCRAMGNGCCWDT